MQKQDWWTTKSWRIASTVMIYYAGYATGKIGWTHLWHNLSWQTMILSAVLFLLATVLAAMLGYWPFRRIGTK